MYIETESQFNVSYMTLSDITQSYVSFLMIQIFTFVAVYHWLWLLEQNTVQCSAAHVILLADHRTKNHSAVDKAVVLMVWCFIKSSKQAIIKGLTS